MPRFAIAVLTAALLAAVLTSATPAPARADSAEDTVIIELRVWQRVNDAENLWVSARPRGGRWDTLGTIPLPEDGRTPSYGNMGQHTFGDIAMAGVGVRVWQRTHEPERIYVQACGGCEERWRPWRPLGKIPLPLDDGHSPNGRYRYGDINVAVPRDNPGLVADREHLLALRDVLAGDGAELDWDIGTPTTSWEGVTVARTPPRVSALRLVDRGLTGEIWGYLGDLTELRVLRLNGNALAGMLPSKLSLLTKLRWVYLSGNEFEGCVPPRLRQTKYNDLDSLSLPDCPIASFSPSYWFADGYAPDDPLTGTVTPGTHYFLFDSSRHWYALVFDVPPGRSVWMEHWDWSVMIDRAEPATSIFDVAVAWGFVLRDAADQDAWLFLEERTVHTAIERERSHYSGCIYDCVDGKSHAAWMEQLAASLWVNTSIGDDREWVWP